MRNQTTPWARKFRKLCELPEQERDERHELYLQLTRHFAIPPWQPLDDRYWAPEGLTEAELDDFWLDALTSAVSRARAFQPGRRGSREARQ